MVQYEQSNRYRPWDEFSIHPYIPESGYFAAYDKGRYTFKSNRPEWEEKKETERPVYTLLNGQLKPEHEKTIIAAVDDFVRKNFDQ